MRIIGHYVYVTKFILFGLSFKWQEILCTSCVQLQIYTLTKERDTLHREQNKKSDAAALLKEKDEIINQVMAEGNAV